MSTPLQVVVVVTTMTVQRTGRPTLRWEAFGPFASWQAASAVAIHLAGKGIVAHPVRLQSTEEVTV